MTDPTIRKTPVFYNAIGPTSQNSGGGDGDDIYIECHPTGSDGKVLVPEPLVSGGGMDIASMDITWDNPFIIAILCLIGLICIWYASKMITKKVFSGGSTTVVPLAGGHE